MKLRLQLIGLLIGCSGMALAQEHVHGQGSVFIIQQDKYWQVQYVIPASDVLGFTHKPENQLQRTTLIQLTKVLSHYQHLMRFNKTCEQDSYSHNLLAFEVDNQSLQHEHHSHDSQHSDLEVTYLIKCSDDIVSISFLVFHQFHRLDKLDVQWSTNRGQGKATVSSTSPLLELQ